MTQMNENINLPSHDVLEEEAGYWLSCLDAAAAEGGLDQNLEISLDRYAAKDAEFAVWLSQSASHRVALLSLISVWRRAERLKALPPERGTVVEMPAKRKVPAAKVWAVAASLLFAAIGAGLYMQAPVPQVYQTARGAQELVPMPDGSRMELNSDTRVAVDMRRDMRLITLEKGEAFFSVSSDSKRPFKVKSGDQVVTVLGTSFSVHQRASGIEVMVLEGRVRVEDKDATIKPAVLRAGDIAKADGHRLAVRNANREQVEKHLSWREGYLVFDESPLAEAFAEFNRYHDTQLVLNSASLAEIPLSGKFKIESFDAFVGFLEDGFNFNVARIDGKILVSDPDFKE